MYALSTRVTTYFRLVPPLLIISYLLYLLTSLPGKAPTRSLLTQGGYTTPAGCPPTPPCFCPATKVCPSCECPPPRCSPTVCAVCVACPPVEKCPTVGLVASNTSAMMIAPPPPLKVPAAAAAATSPVEPPAFQFSAAWAQGIRDTVSARLTRVCGRKFERKMASYKELYTALHGGSGVTANNASGAGAGAAGGERVWDAANLPPSLVFRCFETNSVSGIPPPYAQAMAPPPNPPTRPGSPPQLPAEELCGGLGDRFGGLTSSFALAILHNRPLLMEYPMAALAIQPFGLGREEGGGGGLNWMPPPGYLEAARSQSGEGFYNLVNAECPLETRKVNWGLPVVTIKSNRGCVNKVWSAAHTLNVSVWRDGGGGGGGGEESRGERKSEEEWAEEGERAALFASLRATMESEWGLHSDTAFGCLLGSLVAPTDALLATFAPTITLLLDPTLFVVGVHIRVGDAAMGGIAPPPPLSKYAPAFEAALRLGEERAGWGQSVRLLLVTDCGPLKEAAVKAYGGGVLITTPITPSHVAKRDALGGMVVPPLEANLNSFGEWWLLSLCSAASIAGSGYSHTASAVSLRPGGVHVWERGDWEGGKKGGVLEEGTHVLTGPWTSGG